MPRDADARLRPFQQPRRILTERRTRVVAQRGLVVVEERVGERAFGIQLVEGFPAEDVRFGW